MSTSVVQQRHTLEVIVGKRELHNPILVVDFNAVPLRELSICVPLVVLVPGCPIRRPKEGSQHFSIRRRHAVANLTFHAGAKTRKMKSTMCRRSCRMDINITQTALKSEGLSQYDSLFYICCCGYSKRVPNTLLSACIFKTLKKTVSVEGAVFNIFSLPFFMIKSTDMHTG